MKLKWKTQNTLLDAMSKSLNMRIKKSSTGQNLGKMKMIVMMQAKNSWNHSFALKELKRLASLVGYLTPLISLLPVW